MAADICSSLAGCFPLRLAPQGWGGPVSLPSQPLPALTPALSRHHSGLEGGHERFSILLPVISQDSCYQGPQSRQATAAISTSWLVPEDAAHKAVFGFSEVPLGLPPAWECWYHKHTEAWGRWTWAEEVQRVSAWGLSSPKPAPNATYSFPDTSKVCGFRGCACD